MGQNTASIDVYTHERSGLYMIYVSGSLCLWLRLHEERREVPATFAGVKALGNRIIQEPTTFEEAFMPTAFEPLGNS